MCFMAFFFSSRLCIACTTHKLDRKQRILQQKVIVPRAGGARYSKIRYEKQRLKPGLLP